MQSENPQRIGCAEQLRLSTWNCGGLASTTKQLCEELEYDILGITETHDKGALPASSNFIPAEPAPTNDSFAGVALLLSQRIAPCVMNSGCISSRIVYARVRAAICNIFAICVYIPHSNRTNPSRADTLADLNKLLSLISPADCIVILGDFNSILPRSYEKLTGRWCVHKNVDNHGGGTALLDLMSVNNLVAASTLHQPRRGHTNATFMPRDPRYKPRQIDYILCSRRWVSSVCSSRVRWGITMQRWGRKYDHGLVEVKWKAKLIATPKKRTPDFTALKDSVVAANFDSIVSQSLENEPPVNPDCTKERFCRLNRATKLAIETLPPKKRLSTRKRYVSDRTRTLITNRVKHFGTATPEERRLINREINRSCRNDYRTYINNTIGDIAAAANVGNAREVSRLTKQISSNPKSGTIMPSKASDGTPFTTTDQLAKAWYEFMNNKFSCADRPGCAYAPGIDEHLQDEDVVTWDEFNECVSGLRTGRAPGIDETPIEVYLASPSAKTELYNVVQLIWKTEDIPSDFVHAIFVMLYKKGARDEFANYRAIGLLCHTKSYRCLCYDGCNLLWRKDCQIRRQGSERLEVAVIMF